MKYKLNSTEEIKKAKEAIDKFNKLFFLSKKADIGFDKFKSGNLYVNFFYKELEEKDYQKEDSMSFSIEIDEDGSGVVRITNHRKTDPFFQMYLSFKEFLILFDEDDATFYVDGEEKNGRIGYFSITVRK